jgi:ribosome-binding protein aMBF1 (putative translation factor)
MSEREDKPLVWLAGEIKTPPFSTGARIEAGTLLRRLQKGENIAMPHSRRMLSIGARCHCEHMTKSGEARTMKKKKKERLEKAGWKVGTVKEFLGLTHEEAALIEMKLALARSLKERRLAHTLTQEELAKELGSSQSRVAKMEAADATVSMELLVRSLLLLGASRQEVGRIIGRKRTTPAA